MDRSTGEEKNRPRFGNRFLTDPRQVFEHNAWDNVVWDEEQEAEAKRMVGKNSKTPVPSEDQDKYEQKSGIFWDEFYMQHKNRFFKDRHWLFTEFPELVPNGVPDHIPRRTELTQEHNTESGEELRQKKRLPDMQSEGKILNTVVTQNEGSHPSLDPEEFESNKPIENKLSHNDSPHVPSAEDRFPGQYASTRFLEVGCGVGNTVFPVLQMNNNPNLFVYCCDLSATAIGLLKEHPDYNVARCQGFVCDVSDPAAEFPFPNGSLDLVILIFVLSAIHPDKMQATIDRLVKALKPGGLIVFRDYGRYDLAQLRFKDGKCLQDNFYVRGDGTCVYFFTQEELRQMFTKSGLVEEQNLVDRRLQVNRGRQLKMYRVWVQCKYRKPTQ